ncbi:translation initiation factor IF-2-like [Dermochelys coriacea]|uniref:translation initiation factor IF-2-like n=1 Tax=Dermochelys coriacea TaxID=27794 RepID=UPI001CA8984D|nr:translation initiation factor IF-2-like [Dermochelys coriacea]
MVSATKDKRCPERRPAGPRPGPARADAAHTGRAGRLRQQPARARPLSHVPLLAHRHQAHVGPGPAGSRDPSGPLLTGRCSARSPPPATSQSRPRPRPACATAQLPARQFRPPPARGKPRPLERAVKVMTSCRLYLAETPPLPCTLLWMSTRSQATGPCHELEGGGAGER